MSLLVCNPQVVPTGNHSESRCTQPNPKLRFNGTSKNIHQHHCSTQACHAYSVWGQSGHDSKCTYSKFSYSFGSYQRLVLQTHSKSCAQTGRSCHHHSGDVAHIMLPFGLATLQCCTHLHSSHAACAYMSHGQQIEDKL